MSDRLPLLVRLCHAPRIEHRVDNVNYDFESETAEMGTSADQIVATQSLLTAAQVDPSNDEPTDR